LPVEVTGVVGSQLVLQDLAAERDDLLPPAATSNSRPAASAEALPTIDSTPGILAFLERRDPRYAAQGRY
jgi:hypothetical protein